MRRPAPVDGWVILLLLGLPTALIRIAGSPLPTTLPTRAEVERWIEQPLAELSPTGAAVFGGWLLWLLLTTVLVVEGYRWLVRRRRRPRLQLPQPAQLLTATLVGTATVSATQAGAVAADTGATAATVDNTPLGSAPHASAPTAAAIVAPATQAPPERVNAVALEPVGSVTPLRHGGRHGHKVVEGESLWRIADKTLGAPNRWPEIWRLNRGKQWPNVSGRTIFSDPNQILPGWILTLPSKPNPPTAEQPRHEPATPPTTASPTNPTPSTGPTTTAHQTPAPTGPGGGATSASSTGSTSSATPRPHASTPSHGRGAEPHADDRSDEAGITLPAEGWVSLGFATTLAAVAAMLRLQRRRRARLTCPVPVSTRPQPSPVPPSFARVDAIGDRKLGAAAADYRPTEPAVPAPVGVDADGAEVSLFDLPGAAVSLHGDGAVLAARAMLASTLSTGALESACEPPVVVTTADLLARLLPEDSPTVGLDPDSTAYDGERLIVLADTAAAVTHAEEEMITRRRLLDTFDTDIIAALNARTDHAEMQPPYVLLIEATDRHAARLHAVAAYRAALDLHPVIIGARSGLDGFPDVEVAADGRTVGGAVTDDDPSPVARWATLGAADLAAVLAMLADVLARPEDGTDVDEPSSESTRATASTEPAEPVPAQRGGSSALVRLRALGPVTVATDAGPIVTGMRSGSYTVLALLAAHPAGRTLDQVAAALHPDADPTVAVKRVRTDITTARRVLRAATGRDGAMFVVYDQNTGRYRLDPETVGVDLWQMLTAIEQANTADRKGDGDAAVLAALRQATELYGGDFAEGHDQAWAVDYATAYRHQILSVYARIAEILEADHPDQAVAALERAAELDPVNEELYQRIMRIHGRQHRPDAVRRTLRRLEERLADLGGAEPSQATRRVAERQLRPAAPVSGGQR